MKNSTIIFLSLLILLSLAISFMSLDTVGSDRPKYGDNADTTSEPSSSSKQTSATQSSPSGVYFDSNYGYQTIGDVTYFFKRFDTESYYADVIYREYSDYEPKCYASWDLNSWILQINIIDSDSEKGYINYQFSSRSSAYDHIYITYCVVNNCSDPGAVLSDLKKNVFESTYFNVAFYETAGDVTQNPAS